MKFASIKFHEKSFHLESRRYMLTERRKGTRDEANMRFSRLKRQLRQTKRNKVLLKLAAFREFNS